MSTPNTNTVEFTRHGAIAVLTASNPPVNVISAAIRRDLRTAFEQISARPWWSPAPAAQELLAQQRGPRRTGERSVDPASVPEGLFVQARAHRHHGTGQLHRPRGQQRNH